MDILEEEFQIWSAEFLRDLHWTFDLPKFPIRHEFWTHAAAPATTQLDYPICAKRAWPSPLQNLPRFKPAVRPVGLQMLQTVIDSLYSSLDTEHGPHWGGKAATAATAAAMPSHGWKPSFGTIRHFPRRSL